ncbi:general transcription factor II-I repeat domain-containing protein 2B-like [Acyrthosiphon pisum]|uniref:SPIN-DOC-like zinc-finger domain-containing protein n=1 Tax=Acyrthosiphon pisum TaxID=7029 RepID=A0A8R2AY93_ACYPI|nr:general transcription factor II-I repeat domain-containing protein 2B-like [Acyrthosiphon pisum]|eukprot:XP_008178225.1 PREDICTED: general transcription factor II-I repeat domain-containing protein 2B-like [Acyrthosiphon pisum]
MSLSKPSGSNKRNITDEHRQFQENWELQYFCSEINNKILCLICKSVISVPMLYNIKRHYEQHKSKYDQYEGLLREEKLKEFISGYKKQQIMFTKIPQENEAAVKVSYVLSELIAKHSKPFTEGDFIKTCLIKTAEIICPGNLKAFQNISLTRNTVAERITELACNLNNQIKIKIPTFEYFSIACDESTDIGGTAQLAVFFRACDMEFNIFEELLEIIPMFDTTTGEDVFVSVFELLKKYDLSLEKLSSVATDGAPSMTGKNKGFVERLQKKANEYVEHTFHRTHCIIHQEVLCTKVINMAHVIKPIKQMVNFIRSRGLNQRQFSIFLNDLESEYSGLPYFTEVRWLSCSTVLERFRKLRDTIQIFLESKEQDVSVLSDIMWLQDISFMVDITKHLSNSNLKLQEKNQIITAINDHVKVFKCKLDLFKTQLQNKDLTHFPACMTCNQGMNRK